MDSLLQHQANLLRTTDNSFTRYLFGKLPWNERFVGLKGLRGVGKTTMLLQHLKYNLGPGATHLYVTLDHPYFYNQSLFSLAEEFVLNGGKTLLVDEVHKLANWYRELKIIYDAFPALQVVFTASSALDIQHGEADLSRRVRLYKLGGLSFREYLHFYHQMAFPVLTLEELRNNHLHISHDLLTRLKPIPLFKEYLAHGYFPFGKTLSHESFEARLLQTIEVVMNQDLTYVEGFSAAHIFKIKKLLGILAETVPFTANITSLSEKLGIGRNTVTQYLHAMENAGILNFLNREGKGVTALQKPDKMYPENTNFAYAIKYRPDKGTLRETFLVNQLKNAGYNLTLPHTGDLMVQHKEDTMLIEVGGKEKQGKQIASLPNSFIAADDIETGFGNKIPLFLFGFLY